MTPTPLRRNCATALLLTVLLGGNAAAQNAAQRSWQPRSGMLDDIAALADPGASRVLKWNDTSNEIEWAVDATGGGGGGDVDGFAADPSSNGNFSASEFRNDLGLAGLFQPLDADLTAIAGLTSAANKGIYFSGSGTAATFDLTAFGRTLAGSADASAARTSLLLRPGTDIHAFDTDIASIGAGVTGLVKGAGNGGGYAAAVANTDYLAPNGAMSGGTVNSSVIGGTTPAAITGTTITATTSVTTVDDAYNSGTWDGNNTVPTKNAVRDQIQTMLAGGGLGTGDIDTSAELRSIVTDETGTGALVFATSPTLTTPNLGTPSAVTLTNGTGLPIAGLTGLGTGVGTLLATPSSANLAAAITNETGSGVVVFATSPSLTTPTISGGVLTGITTFELSAPLRMYDVIPGAHGEISLDSGVYSFEDSTSNPAALLAGSLAVSPFAYNATSWNGSANVPTMDAVRDQIVAITAPTFITQTASSELANEQAMGSLATGLVKNTTTTGVQSIAVANTDYLSVSGGSPDFVDVDASIGTITASDPFTFAQTWNNGSVDFNAIDVNVTRTASGSGSNFIRFRDNGTVFAGINKNGNMYCTDFFVLGAAGTFDVLIGRYGSHHAGMANSSSPQRWSVANTFSSDTSYERVEMSWASNVAQVGTEKGSTGGSSRALALKTEGTNRVIIGVNPGHVTPGADSSQNLGASGTEWLNVYSDTVTAGALAGNAWTALRKKTKTFQLVGNTTDGATGDGAAYYPVPPELNGANITYVHLWAVTAGTTGTSDVQIARVRSGSPVDVLSTKLTIDSTEQGSDTAAAAAVINTSNDDVATNDVLRVDVDALSTTKPKGLIVTIGFELQ